MNPLAVCHRLHREGKTPDGWWSAFTKRATAIGATIPPPLVFGPVPPAPSFPQPEPVAVGA